MTYKKRTEPSIKIKMIAVMLLFVFTCQLVYPSASMALTTGPSQPESQGFEPVGTTDMVDMFSGDFTYNVPLLDVEGYPVNIAYHAGIGMEQEASWVGLGWNINPGMINRTVRGVPDDFNGDSVLKELNIKPDETVRVGLGFGGEFFGKGDPDKKKDPDTKFFFDLGAAISINNYRGTSADFSLGCGINIARVASAGINTGVGTQTGASIDYNASLALSKAASQRVGSDAGGGGGYGLNMAVGGGYSTRSGIKDINLSFSIAAPPVSLNGPVRTSVSAGFNSYCNIPIGTKNYVPVITNSSTMYSISGRFKLGFEMWGGLGYGTVNGSYSKLSYDHDASRSSYGYLYLQNASNDGSSILDFTRDKDGMFNKSMQYLPVPHMTYDIYSVSGQGTGGMFRPFRNDFGSVYDPHTESRSSSSAGGGELGIGNLFEAGLDYTHTNTEITSGPWLNYQRFAMLYGGFTGDTSGSLYEHVFFKQGGELTYVDSNYFSLIGKTNPITPDQYINLPIRKPGSGTQRDARANLFFYHTAKEDTIPGVGSSPDIPSYTDANFSGYANPGKQSIRRIGTGHFQRKKDQISEIVQVQKDGRKYVYGIPAMNNVQKEVTFTVDPKSVDNPVNLNIGTVGFVPKDASVGNRKGKDNYFSSTVTPSYAHSYLLTSVLSSDYVDVTGDGASDDDLGSFTKFNYTRTDSDYRWVAPYSTNVNIAQYSPGFWSDKQDDKASFVTGSREQWYLHAIETKNFIAEFYTSPRQDAKGIIGEILHLPGTIFGIPMHLPGSVYSDTKSSPSLSYKLDSIKLYNKHDRFINKENAIPVKTVIFTYKYSLCPGTPNSTAGQGKLTLSKIFFRYGNSQKSMISPYQFGYSSNNPSYNLAAKDRWGNYKPNNTAFTNYEYPYVDQNDTSNNRYAAAWQLDTIFLPSGGMIKVNYESKDYAYVQDKPANEMFMVQGIGNSPNFGKANQLYINKNAPCLYTYFRRRPGNELPALTFAQNYLGVNYQPNGPNCMYFNFNVRLTGAESSFEQIKGYANVTDIGICANDTMYGYIKLKSSIPTGGGGTLNPITYTALNVARYNLPQVVFPGSDPDETGWHNILAGIKSSFPELLDIGKSPVLNLINKKQGGKIVNISKSYIRLQNVGLSKKGGGYRVRSLYFYDQWKKLAGGNELNAYYGKQYDYTIYEPGYGRISSGVASYEPMVGGDENPLRQPVPYNVQAGSTFPPNDPVDLYQELPIGESLFPSPQVGYRLVTVSSVHASEGRSSQGVDKYEFYTAKDFPAQVIATAVKSESKNNYSFFFQSNTFSATQGYTLIFNDMHGKAKKVEHDVYNPASQTFQPISYQVFNYKQKDGRLDNEVPCLVYNGSEMVRQNRTLGIEEDVTLDSRRKTEVTRTSTMNANLNAFLVPVIIPVPITIPLSFSWGSEGESTFESAAVTKVVQQYGILDAVTSFNEGALTVMKNELYDPFTGQPLVTSVNNEFHEKEYTTNLPASWVYKGMAQSYNNIGYEDDGFIIVDANHIGKFFGRNANPLVVGDELAVSFSNVSNQKHNITVRVMSVFGDTTHVPLPVWSPPGSPAWETTHRFDTSFNKISRLCIYGTQLLWDRQGPLVPSGVPQFSIQLYGQIDTCIDNFDFDSIYMINYHLRSADFLDYSPYPHGGPIDSQFTIFDTIVKVKIHMYNPIPYEYRYPILALRDSLTMFGFTYFPKEQLDDPGFNMNIDSNANFELFKEKIYNATLPRFPLNTPGWNAGDTLKNVHIRVINSGQTNRLNETVETYTSIDHPVDAGTGVLNSSLTRLVNLSAKTFADSNTSLLHRYIANADTVNPFYIGERGVWRLYTEFNYQKNRTYSGTTGRNAGLFAATSLFAQPPNPRGPYRYVKPYNYLAPNFGDNNWHRSRTITKYSPSGKEIENIDAIGNYSTAVFGYNEELPVAVASNAKQGEVFSDGFEDYNLLQYSNSIMNYTYSPFKTFGSTGLGYSSTLYHLLSLNPSGAINIVGNLSHTGMSCLSVPSVGGAATYNVDIPVNRENYSGMRNNYNIYFPNILTVNYPFSSRNEYMPFSLNQDKKYILSYWVKEASSTPNITDYTVDTGCGVVINSVRSKLIKKSDIIDGWQQVEVTFPVTPTDTTAQVVLPAGYYVDDIRVYPVSANMKSFVYHPVNEKLMATLDENNFATMYEYDQEGNLVRVKKETTKGVMTVSESRSSNPKTLFP